MISHDAGSPNTALKSRTEGKPCYQLADDAYWRTVTSGHDDEDGGGEQDSHRVVAWYGLTWGIVYRDSKPTARFALCC
jgi:hypothetical protein